MDRKPLNWIEMCTAVFVGVLTAQIVFVIIIFVFLQSLFESIF